MAEPCASLRHRGQRHLESRSRVRQSPWQLELNPPFATPVPKYDARKYGAEWTVKAGACLSFSPTVFLRRNFRQLGSGEDTQNAAKEGSHEGPFGAGSNLCWGVSYCDAGSVADRRGGFAE